MRTQKKGVNSVANPRPLFEIEIDLKDMGIDIKHPSYRDGLEGIDNFTEQAWVSPLSGKTPGKLIEGTKDIIKQIGKTEQFHSDQEVAFHPDDWMICQGSEHKTHRI